jgi:Mrp family chromosome partitioning ATPase
VGEVLNAVALSSDWVFVHVAPLLEHPDALFLAPSIPDALLVASAEKTKANQIEGCVTRLCDAGVRVLGVVVTNIRPQYADKKIA